MSRLSTDDFKTTPSSGADRSKKVFRHDGRQLVTGLLVLLLSTSLLLADDTQQAKSSTEKSLRLQRILDHEVPRDVEDLKVMQEKIRRLAKKSLDVTVGLAIGRSTQGSGVIVSEDGYVLTAAHVAGRPNRRVAVFLADGRVVQGYTLGIFKSVDAGLVKIGNPNDEQDAKVKWPFAEMADSRKAVLGQWCLATGHPGGFQPERQPVVRVGRVIHKYKDVLTTDCTLISGDSGGPLFDLDGKVIGIHSRIGFELRHNVHVPVHHYKDNWQRLLDAEVWGTMPASPFIGVSGPANLNKTQVNQVKPGSPAEKAGIKVGDVIVKFGDDQVTNFDSLIALVGLRRPGEKVEVTVLRRKEKVVVTLTVGSVGAESSQATAPGYRTGFQATPTENESYQRPVEQQTAAGAAYLGMWQQISLLRPVSVNQRNHASIRKSFRDVVAGPVKSTVRIFAGKRQVALGVVVDDDGYILTKASQLPGAVECQFSDGTRVAAEVANIQTRHDLALLKVDRKGLTAIEWNRNEKIPVGSWLAVPSHLAEPLAIGVLSLEKPLEIKGGVLGVLLEERSDGVGIARVMPDGGGQRAGLQRGDVVVKVNGQEMKSLEMVVDTVRQHLPGEQVNLVIRRGEETLSMKATLGRIGDLSPVRQAVPQDKLGGPLSKRRSGFPTVLQHDTVLEPDECGGALVDLDGKAVGINIARAGRVSTYALPSSLVLPLIETMKQAAEKNRQDASDSQ